MQIKSIYIRICYSYRQTSTQHGVAMLSFFYLIFSFCIFAFCFVCWYCMAGKSISINTQPEIKKKETKCQPTEESAKEQGIQTNTKKKRKKEVETEAKLFIRARTNV